MCSVQLSCSVVSDSLWPHESQHSRPPCPSSSPGVHSDSRPSSRWCHPAISSSVIPFFFCPQSLPASESFPMSQLFAWGGQSTGVSALASFLPKKSQGWSPSEWTGWIPLLGHKKEWNITICSNMDKPRDYHTKWSKSDRQRQSPCDITYMFWRRKWPSTPILLPGKSHGQRSLVGYSPWGRKRLSDLT